jgi:hypothetical protein
MRLEKEVLQPVRKEPTPTEAFPLDMDTTVFASYMHMLEEMASAPHLTSFLAEPLAGPEDPGAVHAELRSQLANDVRHGRYHLVPTSLRRYLLALCKYIIKSGAVDGRLVVEFRRLLLAYILFGPGNGDVLAAVRRAIAQGTNSTELKWLTAEFLFYRVPRVLYQRFLRPRIPIEAFVRRLDKIELTVYQRNALTGIVRRAESGTFEYELDVAERAVRLFRIRPEERTRLSGMLQNLRIELRRARLLYEEIVLDEALVPATEWYRQRVWGQREIVTYEKKRIYRREHLDLYPTKDYLDLLKGEVSHDCTTGVRLARAHLAEPRFFNLRVFWGKEWIGNIYCLDFGTPLNALVIDRVQIPCRTVALYQRFFWGLAGAFRRVLHDSRYRYVLVPEDISNHESIQGLLRLWVATTHPTRMEVLDSPKRAEAFESFQSSRPHFLVLAELSKE